LAASANSDCFCRASTARNAAVTRSCAAAGSIGVSRSPVSDSRSAPPPCHCPCSRPEYARPPS
jgi:hypothetical protein